MNTSDYFFIRYITVLCFQVVWLEKEKKNQVMQLQFKCVFFFVIISDHFCSFIPERAL